MRSKLLALLALAIVVAATIGIAAAWGHSCEDVLAPTESRLQPVTNGLAERRLPPDESGGVGPSSWSLSTGEAEFGPGLIEVGGWTAYVNRSEISRIDGDGTIRWTRSAPDVRAEAIGEGRLAVTTFIDSRFRLAVIDSDGDLVRCDHLGPVSNGVVGDGVGGYASTGGAPGQDAGDEDRVDVVRRIDADGTERWSAELDAAPGRFVDRVAIVGGLTIFGRADPVGGTVFAAFDDETGDLQWTIDDDGQPALAPATAILGVVDDRLYVAVDDEEGSAESLLSIDRASGTILWSKPAIFSLFEARVIEVGETIVILTSADAAAIDPDSGEPIWSSPGRHVAFDHGGQGVATVGSRPLYPSADGRLINLIDGQSSHLFDNAAAVNPKSVAIDGGTLLVDTAVNIEGSASLTFLSGWPFDPESVDLDEPTP